MGTVTLRYIKQQYTHTKANERKLVLTAQVESACINVKDSRTSVNLFIHHSIKSLWVSNNRNLTQASLSRKRALIVKDTGCLRPQQQKCSWVNSRSENEKAIRNCVCSVTCPCFSLCICLFVLRERIYFSAACSMWQTSDGSQDHMS